MTPRPHRGVVTALIVFAVVTGVLATFAIWSARQLLETDAWTQTSSELIDDPEIQAAISGFLVTELFDNVDVQGELAGALPPELAPLAGPAAGGLRQLANQIAPKVLEQPRVQQLWEDANRAAHQRLLDVVNGDTAALGSQGGRVYLDLGVILRQLGAELGIGIADKVPTGVAQLDVMSANDLQAAQDGVRILKAGTLVLILVTVGAFVLAVYLAAGWRRVALRSVGFSLVAIGVIVLVARGIAGHYVVGALTGTVGVQPAAEAAWSIGTSLLKQTALAMAGYGVAVLLGAWVAGPGKAAVATRRAMTPFLAERRTMYPILLALVLLLLWWGPTEGTRRLVPMLILTALLVAGAEVLRSQAMREFPAESMERLSARWRSRLAAARASLQRPRIGAAATSERSAPDDERITRLERLAELRACHALTEEEYATEKQRVLTT